MTAASPGVELTADPTFTRRVRRLVWVSALGLGVISGLAVGAGAPGWALVLLVAGWLMMPALLAVSIQRPPARLLLVVPASCVTLGLVGVLTTASPLLGWAMVTAGVAFGGTLGMWFWFGWAPVPGQLRDPFGRPRLGMVAIHVGLVVLGISLVAAGL